MKTLFQKREKYDHWKIIDYSVIIELMN